MFRFGTAINCIDARTQEVVIDYMKLNYHVDGVDMVTLPGVDGILSGAHHAEMDLVKRAVTISVEKHGSSVIAVVGHHDCAGNPGDREHHRVHLRDAVIKVASWDFPVQVLGLYVNDKWRIEEI